MNYNCLTQPKKFNKMPRLSNDFLYKANKIAISYFKKKKELCRYLSKRKKCFQCSKY